MITSVQRTFRFSFTWMLMLYMLPAMAQSVDYRQSHNISELENRMPDTDKAVGSLAGAHSVSATGGATYSIPIDVAPGTNGMVPELSFVYNSQGGNSLLGWGWNLAGTSAIIRTGRDPYHDGVTAPVQGSMDDRFSLDGQRLVLMNGTYGDVSSSYDTEAASFSKIKLILQGGSNASDLAFEVITKEGMTLQYGVTNDAKILSLLDDRVNVWRLNQVMDPYGNYIEYLYSGNEPDSRLQEIRYTGNSSTGLAPYDRVLFSYQDRTDVNNYYAPGSRIGMTKLLKQVEVLTENDELVRRYQLTYSWRDDRGSYLNDITLIGADGTSSFNATQFAYGDLDLAQSVLETTSTTSNSSIGEKDLIIGDFDGNGISDKAFALVAYTEPPNILRYHSRINIYMNGNSGSPDESIYLDGTSIVDHYNTYSQTYRSVSRDLNGDGRDDLIISKVVFDPDMDPMDNGTGQWSNPNDGVWRVAGMKLIYSISIGNLPVFEQIAFEPIGYPFNAVKNLSNYLQIGDFNGDAKTDVLILYNDVSELSFGWAFLFTNGNWVQVQPGIQESFVSQSGRILSIDFDGDGSMELMAIKSNSISSYTY